MKKERTLAFQLSKKVTAEDLEKVVAGAAHWTGEVRCRDGKWEGAMDADVDL